MRKIIHVDMDAFYAAIEQRDDVTLRGRPVAVGGGGNRGVVMTASYEARVFGVRSAMPSAHARRLCPDLVFVRPRFEAYKAASRQIRELFLAVTPDVEPLSLDEAYLDVTEATGGGRPAVDLARALKAAVRERTGLTASAGVSFNKFLAKIASDLDKPDGLAVIRPEAAIGFIAGLPVERFHGVGPATLARLRAMGITTGRDLQERDEAELVQALGRAGAYFHALAHARDDRPVRATWSRKSLSCERTFESDLATGPELRERLGPLARELAERLGRSGFRGRSLTLKVKLADFRIITRTATRQSPPVTEGEILELARSLLARAPIEGRVRLLGLGVGHAGRDADERQYGLDLATLPAIRESGTPEP